MAKRDDENNTSVCLALARFIQADNDTTGDPLRNCKPGFATLAFAQSLNGIIGSRAGARLVLSSQGSFYQTHRLRSVHDTIVVGIGTVLCDDPRLTVRLPGTTQRHLKVAVIDPHLKLPRSCCLLKERHRNSLTIVTTSSDTPGHLKDCRFVRFPPGRPIELSELWRRLGGRIMVEGGARVIEEVLRQRAADLVFVTISPRLYADGVAIRCSSSFGTKIHWETQGDLWIAGTVPQSDACHGSDLTSEGESKQTDIERGDPEIQKPM